MQWGMFQNLSVMQDSSINGIILQGTRISLGFRVWGLGFRVLELVVFGGGASHMDPNTQHRIAA